MKNAIIYLKNNVLRLSDNQAIESALKSDYSLVFLYIYDEKLNIGAASKWFLHHALKSLEDDLQERYGAKLIIKSGSAKEILDDLVTKYQISAIFYNRTYEPDLIKRDTKLKEHFKNKNIEIKSFNSSLLFEPKDIKNLSGEYFKVFTPFWKKCLSEISKISDPTPLAKKVALAKIANSESLKLADLKLLPTKPNWACKWDKIYKISEKDAHNIADNFIKNKIDNYKQGRDFPASDNTSILSPYLHFGLISPKQIYFKLLPHLNSKGAIHFLSEVGWREFSYYLLYYFPELETKNFKDKFDNFPWQNNQELLRKWQKGETGFPLIDAGMRQLWHTGWMHNRVRMVVASFLIKNLLIDWRLGQEWFWDCLVDADLAANSASWQWVAGSGADAAPYFRIFNPLTQSEKFDPKGDYIRKWVPEIAHLDDKEIHCPQNRENYFAPIIDLKNSRNKALEIYKNLP